MNEQQLLKLESRLHNPRFANSAGECAGIILSPSEILQLIAANRQLIALRNEKEGEL